MSFTDFLKNSGSYTAAAKEALVEVPRIRRVTPAPFYINKLPLVSSLPQSTQHWIRSEADERACIEHGCLFDEARGRYAVDWVEANCILYEGDTFAGEHITIDDWQYEMYMQGFGWQIFDEEWEQRRVGAGWVRRYTIISGWIPKKNAKSPTLGSVGLYLFAGDGEQGQKCFSLATTRDQALISHTHALNFVRQSPSLMARCKIDATTGTITDTWTKSTYSILCGDKGGLKVSKEGINGSLIIDETHVVDAAFMGIVNRAGISRRQPLRIQLSTSGDNTAGYGFTQYQLGRENLRAAGLGGQYNHRMYHFEYSIPQDTSVDDLRNPEKIDDFIRISNPTIGRIVRFGEAKDDWRASCRSDTELARFAMYRLNQWITGAGAFIAGSDWNRCGRQFKLSEVEEFPCIIGVDMSRCRDMTCTAVMWAVPKIMMLPENPFELDSRLVETEVNVPYVKPYFWAPKRSLSQFTGKIDAQLLHERKQLFITESPIVKVEAIAEHINSIDDRFFCKGVASDMYASAKLAGCLSGLHSWEVEGPSSRFFLVPSNAAAISPAIEQLQGCVLGQELVQDNNEVMNWQLGNITVIENKDGDKKFQKPTQNDWRKIDGWAAQLNGIYYMMTDADMYPGQIYSIKLNA